MRKLYLLLTLLFLSLPIFSHEGSLAGAGKLRVSQTKYFDIIYGEKNLTTASILYENADAVFEELAAEYGVEPSFRLPVCITTTVEQFNAYYSDSPYNRIVIYDTAQIEDLAVFSQTLLLTFTHELTHAFTYNLKNKGMKLAGKIFGDAWSSHYITVTSGMAEGATVSYESSKGEGRLNDSYSLQMVRQAKLEDKFPSYSDVKGSSDAYPRGAFYYFNGAFADFLQRNFGMHKYAEFWYRCINTEHLSDITAAGAFKKTYGIKLDKAWKMFEEAFEVPKVASANPVQAGQAKDFFDEQGGSFSIKNNAGSRYTDLCVCDSGFAYIDESCNTIYFVEKGREAKPKKLFHQDYLDGIRLSKDGRFLAISYYSTASSTVKHCAKLYDFETKKIISIPGTNYVCPAVIFADGEYYFIAQKYQDQKYSILLQKLNTKKNVFLCAEPLVYTFEAKEVPEDFTDLGNGQFAFTLKSELAYSIRVTDINFSNFTEYPVPYEKMKIRDLSFASDKLLFSWATKETLPRLGMLSFTDGTFSLMEQNISGGIYTPVQHQNHIYYTAQFYKQSRLLELVNANMSYQSVSCESQSNPSQNDILDKLSRAQGRDIPYKPFSPFSYAFSGFLIPVGGLNSQTPTLGLTYLNSLPWYASITMISGGYETQSKTGIFDISYQSGTDTSLFQYAINSELVIDKKGFKKTSASATISSGFDFGKRQAVLFTAQADANYGRLSTQDENEYFTSIQLGTVSWSNISTAGPGTYEKTGITLTTGLVHSYEKEMAPENKNLTDVYDVEVDASFYIPKLIPILCTDNFTYNIPAKVKTSIFSLSESDYRLAKIDAEALLFGYDIQKAIPYCSALFLNDIILTLDYIGGYDYASSDDYSQNWHIRYSADYFNQIKSGALSYKDYALVKLSLGFTPNIGAFANPNNRMNFYLSYAFGKKQNLPEKLFNLGFEGKF